MSDVLLLKCDVETFQFPLEKHAPLGIFVDPACMLRDGQVVVDLSARLQQV